MTPDGDRSLGHDRRPVARFPGQARHFVPHDPYALRSRQRWRLLDAATGDPLAWGATDPEPHEAETQEAGGNATDGDRTEGPHRSARAILST